MDYEIVDKPDIPRCRRGGKPIYKPIFDSLPENKAVQFIFNTKKEAKLKAISISCCINRNSEDYSVHCRIVPDGDKFTLYVWKEPKEK